MQRFDELHMRVLKKDRLYICVNIQKEEFKL